MGSTKSGDNLPWVGGSFTFILIRGVSVGKQSAPWRLNYP